MTNFSKVTLAALITAMLMIAVIQACQHHKPGPVGAVGYDVPEDGGSLIGAVKVKPESSYTDVRELLTKYVKGKDETAWREIKEKIDYSYGVLGHALWPVLRKDNLEEKIVAEINAGKKLFFKVNITDASTFGFAGDGTTGPGYPEVEWAFVAALMRFFHDELGICYYQMAIGEAPGAMPATSASLKCTMQGTPHGVEADY